MLQKSHKIKNHHRRSFNIANAYKIVSHFREFFKNKKRVADSKRTAARFLHCFDNYYLHLLGITRVHPLTRERNSVLLYVNVLNSYFNNIAGFEEVGWVLNKAVGHFGNVKKSVVVNAYINETAEVNDVSYSSVKLHAGFKVVYIENVG